MENELNKPIHFNQPSLVGNELNYIKDAVDRLKLSGDGYYTALCHKLLETKYNFQKVLLTTSCTDAIEMASILCNISPGDEVIAPSFAFVSTVNPFVLRGANIVFIDSLSTHPNIDHTKIEQAITSKTKAIIVIHYAGVACDMNFILNICKKYSLFLIEDAAQAFDSFYHNKPLGSFGHFGTISFHETKNVISGEGGCLIINNAEYNSRAEIIREKGTNRSMFFRGEVDKYGWVDVGSSFLPSEIISAFLYAQLENIETIQTKRTLLWNQYYNLLKDELDNIVTFPYLPDFAHNNAHMFYLICNSYLERTALINFLKSNYINAVFHYSSLNKSAYFSKHGNTFNSINADRYSDCLVRLPLHLGLKDSDVNKIVNLIIKFYKIKNILNN